MNFMEFAAENARTEFQSPIALENDRQRAFNVENSRRADAITLQPDMAGVIRRSLALNDDQWKRDEISHAVWSDTYIALLNYATRHGIAEDVLR